MTVPDEAIIHPGYGKRMTPIEHPADGTFSPSLREPGAATALIFEMFERARAMQRDGGTKAELTVELSGPAAQAIGLLGEGSITLTLWPCRPVADLLRGDQP